MDVFNPKILDASIRDVSSCLSDDQKADLLLFSLSKLKCEGRSRVVIENAVQSCLQISNLSPSNIAKAHVLRAKARLAAGFHFGAREDLQSALMVEPGHPEAMALLHQRLTPERNLSPHPHNTSPNSFTRFSSEIWREIALFLPRRDLKTLLSVPHPLSRIASQLLFQRLSLYFGSGRGFVESDSDDSDPSSWPASGSKDTRERGQDTYWHAQRSADILTRIIVDPPFASLVRTLRIFASTTASIPNRREGSGSMAFQTGMLSNALPKLINLRNVHITASTECLVPVLQIVQSMTLRLRGLSISSTGGSDNLPMLSFQHLTQFSYHSHSHSSHSATNTNTTPNPIHALVSQNHTTLRTLSLRFPHPFPSHAPSHHDPAQTALSAHPYTLPIPSLSLRNLTHIDFVGQIPQGSLVISEILAGGRQLESLGIECWLECALSVQFRDACPALSSNPSYSSSPPQPLPFLRHFSFKIQNPNPPPDADLFPAICDFLRNRTPLRTLHLHVPPSSFLQAHSTTAPNPSHDTVSGRLGYSAATFSILPTLPHLRSLALTYPRDLAPGLAGWLIPRGVRALELGLDGVGLEVGSGEFGAFLNQLRQGLPPSLRSISLPAYPSHFVRTSTVSRIVEQGFPMVRLVRVGGDYWSVVRGRGGYVGRGDRDGGGVSGGNGRVELERWPKRRVRYHASEWLEWLGCEDARWVDHCEFPECG